MFKVIIAGNHDFRDQDRLSQFCDKVLSRKKYIQLVSNGATPFSDIVSNYVTDRGYSLKFIGIEWLSNMELAVYRQNIEMCTYSDALIAFWNGENRSTKSLINSAKRRGLKIRVYRYN